MREDERKRVDSDSFWCPESHKKSKRWNGYNRSDECFWLKLCCVWCAWQSTSNRWCWGYLTENEIRYGEGVWVGVILIKIPHHAFHSGLFGAGCGCYTSTKFMTLPPPPPPRPHLAPTYNFVTQKQLFLQVTTQVMKCCLRCCMLETPTKQGPAGQSPRSQD